ncbi:MAG: hypothetical protein JWQ98_1604 [Chlorobi bacterium]|nr:hypothetical protein [Chlorobiota bacterium]
MMGNREQAEDLTQEAWGRLIELKSKGRKLENPLGFLTRIARNLCLDTLKSQRRTLSLDDLPDSVHPSYSMHELSEIEEFAVMSLQNLSFDFREVLVLNIYCGYSFEEIAVMLGKSPRAIWTRASRARAQLRKLVFAVHPNERTPDSSKHVGMEEDHDQ